MTTDAYAEKIVTDYVRNITDYIFCNIQNTEDLMREYQTQVNSSSLGEVNMAIGKKVKEILKLENDGQNNNPNSWLIKYYTYHKVN
jgi:hypothetical protein